MRIEEFPIDKEKAEELIDLFRHKDYSCIKSDKYVYVNLSMVRLQIMWILPKIFYAMGVAKETDAQVVVITWRNNSLLDNLLDSLGVKHLCIEDMNHKNIGAFFKSFVKTAAFYTSHKTGIELQKVKIGRFQLGQALYEDIIRTSSLSTIKSVRNKVCLKKMIHMTWMAYSLMDYLKKNPPVLCVADDIAYHESLQNAIFYSMGATIYSQHIYGESKVLLDDEFRSIRRGKVRNKLIREHISDVGEDAVAQAEAMLKAKFEGKAGRDIDRGAFSGKKVVDRNEIEGLLGLEKGKKNVVIMAHTFSDAVYNYGKLYFRDYYDWLEKTLKIAGSNNNVNWILKPHPTRKVYNENVDSIEKMYDKLKKENIYMLPDYISAESIRNIADVIVTIGGNAGGEFSCFGIPSIIVGEPYYKGFGYTIEPETRKQYEDILNNIDSVKPLTNDQVITAKKVYYSNFTIKLGRDFNDEFAEILLDKNKEMSDKIATKLFASNKGTKQYNNEVLSNIINYFKTHNIEECEYYKRGLLRGKECRTNQN